MEFEFSAYLRPYAEAAILEEFSSKVSDALLHEVLSIAYAAEQIETCPPRYQALICSSIAFQLSSSMARVLGADADPAVMPERIALYIKDRLQADIEPDRQYFLVSHGIHGHLNGVPTELFLRSFLDSLLHCNELFACPKETLVVNRGSKRQHTETKLADVKKGEIIFAPEHLRFLLERASRSRHEEVFEFVSGRALSSRMNQDELLMLLALMADKDIEVKPFSSGFYSRHNVPWYFKRFLADSARFDCSCEKVLGDKLSLSQADLSGISFLQSASSDPVLFALTQSLECLLRSRTTVSQAFLRQRPERAVSCALRMVRAFYGFYNHPNARVLAPLSSGRIQLLGIVSRLLRSNVLSVLRLFAWSEGVG
jgi:hypothetical protein